MAPTPPIARQRPGKTGALVESRRQAWLLLAPALTVLAVLTVYPSIYVLWLSLHDYVPIFGVWRFSGLRHFLFAPTDTRFVSAAGTTVVFTIASVALETILGVAVAVALAGQRRGRHLAFSLLLLAWAMPAVVTARMFEWLYHPAAGLLNYLFGISVNWLGDAATALPAVILADVWRTMPFIAVLAYARLLGIPPELYEAAHVDGAGPVQTFALVTLPLLAPVLMIAVLFRTLDALRAFDIVFVLTGGGPAGRTETLTVYAYRVLFHLVEFGYGAVIGVVVFAAVMAVAWLYLRLLDVERPA
jgi:trehalose/maltose transport system permease protein